MRDHRHILDNGEECPCKAFQAQAEAQAEQSTTEAAPALLEALRGAADMLRQSAAQHRLNGDAGHAALCDMHADICKDLIGGEE